MTEVKLQRYEIVLVLLDNNMTYIDVQYCAFIKANITKTSAFCSIKLILPEKIIIEALSMVTKNYFPKMRLSIHSIQHGDRDDIFDKILYDCVLQCIGVFPDNPSKFNQQTNVCTLILVHPILYYMGKFNTYNKIVSNKRAKDTLIDFHDFITNTFGDIFQYRWIGPAHEINEFHYEHILTKAETDLDIPAYIIDKYHFSHSFASYFFDPFEFSSDKIKEIVNTYINYGTKTNFVSVDVNKYSDMSSMYTFYKSVSISDFKKCLYNKNPIDKILFNQKDSRYSQEWWAPSGFVPYKMQGQMVTEPLLEGRSVNYFKPGLEMTQAYPTTSADTRLYCSDSYENATIRYKNAGTFFDDAIKEFAFYEFSYCVPDFVQFGKIYNLDPHLEDQFLHTPINIMNIFIRENYNEPYLYHSNKTLFLRYRIPPVSYIQDDPTPDDIEGTGDHVTTICEEESVPTDFNPDGSEDSHLIKSSAGDQSKRGDPKFTEVGQHDGTWLSNKPGNEEPGY